MIDDFILKINLIDRELWLLYYPIYFVNRGTYRFIINTEINAAEDFDHREPKSEQHEQIFPFSRREPLSKLQFETSLDESISPTTTLPPTKPAYNPIPTTNPAISTPITVPGQQPITNPVTTYPNVPTTTSVTNPVVPPSTANSAAVPGQSWCVAKSGAPQTALQSALDYACGAGADCSQIQQGASCYNPTTLQNHASYAFNSFYQKNPAPTSCDFGGTATLVNVNPSKIKKFHWLFFQFLDMDI